MRTTVIATTLACLAMAVGSSALGQDASPSAGVSTAPSTPASPVAAASQVPPDTTASAICDPFIPAAAAAVALGVELSSTDATDWQDQRPPLEHVTCRWQVAGDGEIVMELYDLLFGRDRKPFLIEKYGANIGGTALDGLGTKAYTGTEYPGDYVAWAEKLGKVDRTIVISGGETPVEALVAMAHAVDGAASPGSEAPALDTGAGAGASAGAEASALVGAWVLRGEDGKAATNPGVTFTFGPDGSVVKSMDCKPPKGKKAPSVQSTYTADATNLDIAPGTWGGSCKDRKASDDLDALTFTIALATQPGTWSLAGDTLTIIGGPSVTLVLDRAAP